jgi:hypothetical protein
MSQALKSVSVPALSDGDFHIRIDWICDVRPQLNKQDRPAFSVDVLVSRMVPGGGGLTVSNSYPQKCLTLSADILPALWTGAIWRRGKRQVEFGYPGSITLRLQIDSGQDKWMSMDRIPAVSPKSQSTYVVPKEAIKIARAGNYDSVRKTQVLIASHLAGEDNVVIPSIELARFYACPSSLLTRELFAGGWPGLEFPEGTRKDVIDGSAIIGIENMKGVSFSDAFFLARFKHSQEMQRYVQFAGQYLQDPKRAIGFKFGFPFLRDEKYVKLDCDVVKFKDGQQEKYLVTRIIKCHAALPFSSVGVVQKVDPTTDGSANPDDLMDTSFPSRPSAANASRNDDDGEQNRRNVPPLDLSTLNAKPDIPNSVAEVIEFSDLQDRFNFDFKSVRRHTIKPSQKYSNVRVNNQVPVDVIGGVSINPGKGKTGENSEAQIETAGEDKEPTEPITLRLFVDALAELTSGIFKEQIKSVRTNFRPRVHQQDFESINVIVLRSYAHKPTRWYRIKPVFRGGEIARSDPGRSRYLLMAQISFINGSDYLVGEIERVSDSDQFSVFCCKVPSSFLQTCDVLVEKIATDIAKKKGWPSWNSKEQSFTLSGLSLTGRRFLHTVKVVDDATEYARRIVALEYDMVWTTVG